MSIIENVRRLEKRIEKLAERSDVPLQPIEVRKAALDEIEDLVEPASEIAAHLSLQPRHG